MPGRDPATLNREFGRELTFVGGINTTNLFNRTGPEAVRAHVRAELTVLGKTGGYVCGPDHAIMTDVCPATNWLRVAEEMVRREPFISWNVRPARVRPAATVRLSR